jgi:hypothetical protein
MQSKRTRRLVPLALAMAAAAACVAPALASSHREAPFITQQPKVDGTDFYMFRSYEGVAANGSGGRSGYVTLIANYLPLQDPYGGPNYFSLDSDALYEIHVDNDGDAKEDISFQFRFTNELKGITLPIGGKDVAIPLKQAGQVSEPNAATLNVNEKYTVDVVRGDRRGGNRARVTNATGNAEVFDKPVDNIGTKTIPEYSAYAAKHVYSVKIPGCEGTPKLFVGQRQETFAVNLGPIFDLVNAPLGVITDPSLINAAAGNSIQDKNVTSFALEVPIACLKGNGNGVIGGWTTASLRQGRLLDPQPKKGHDKGGIAGGAWTQVSRLGMPLVNEVVIGLPDKDRFNSSKPKDDSQFADYVTNPTLPALLGIALAGDAAAVAPTNFPRTDLVTTFLTGIKLNDANKTNLNQMATVTPSEMLRLNTGVVPVPYAMQNRLGVVGNILASGPDLAGFPNGRRPKDDVVDIALVAVLGGLCLANGDNDALGFGPACKPSAVPAALKGAGTNGLPSVFNVHDAVDQGVVPLLPGFPYLPTPNPGASN